MTQSKTEYPNFCIECGNTVSPQANFCGTCGRQLNRGAVSASGINFHNSVDINGDFMYAMGDINKHYYLSILFNFDFLISALRSWMTEVFLLNEISEEERRGWTWPQMIFYAAQSIPTYWARGQLAGPLMALLISIVLLSITAFLLTPLFGTLPEASDITQWRTACIQFMIVAFLIPITIAVVTPVEHHQTVKLSIPSQRSIQLLLKISSAN